MNCQELQEMFELYALGLLEDEEKREIDRHLEMGCVTCQANLSDAMAVNALMMSAVPPVTPPARLKGRILASVGAKTMSWGWLAALAAAAMLVIALWLSVQERRRASELAGARRTILELTSDRDRLEQAFSFLNQPETEQVTFGRGQPRPARGNVFVHARLGVLLMASNLPALEPGRIFEMWVIPKGGAPRPAGLFRATAEGSAMHILSGPLDTSALGAVAVTVEPEAGSAAPTSQPIVVAPTAGP